MKDKWIAFITEYLVDFNATQAAIRAGYSQKTAYSIGQRLLKNVEIVEAIQAKVDALSLGKDEMLIGLTDHARANIADFFKVVEEWTFWPFPSQEVIGAKDVDILDEKGQKTGKQRTSFWVRHVVIDMDRLTDPRFGRLVKKFSDSPKSGLSIELYDKHSAYSLIGKLRNLMPDRVEIAQSYDDTPCPLLGIPADVISPAFLDAYRDIVNHRHTEYLFYGGRGSTKSSFISLVIIYLLVTNPTIHALATRQVANTMRDSVYAQLCWAIDTLGLTDKFRKTTNPLEITYVPTGQHIYFRGADDPLKIKSLKPPFGYVGLLWAEELDQYRGPEAMRSIEQSAIRGGDIAYIFKSFNPPRTAMNWANKYTLTPKASQYQHKSDYRSVPAEWLGKVFIEEAEHLQSVNPTAYEHEYLGVANGTGGMVFENVQLRAISNDEIAQFDRVLQGLDWGYYPDPFAWGKMHYDAGRHTLYIFDELRMQKAGNRETYEALVRDKGMRADDLLIADSAEPKSVSDYRQYSADGVALLDAKGNPKEDTKGRPILLYGPVCRGAEKGPESVKYSIKWLQSLTAIVIDPQRCPYHADEFLNYELEQDKDGNFISEYPDKNNHFIDDTRYATNLIWRKRGQ